MPLNIENREDIEKNKISVPQPILHDPKPDYSLIKNITIAFLVLAIIFVIIFLVYHSSVNNDTESISSNVLTQNLGEIKNESVIVQSKPINNSVMEKRQDTQSSGIKAREEYTIYVGSFTKKSMAEEEIERWKAAGYTAEIIKAGSYYRVSIGRFQSVNEAKTYVKDLTEYLKNGYWVGKIP